MQMYMFVDNTWQFSPYLCVKELCASEVVDRQVFWGGLGPGYTARMKR